MASPAPTLTLIPTDGGIHVLAETAGRCGGCGTARLIFINRSGRTLCIYCDKKVHVSGHGFSRADSSQSAGALAPGDPELETRN